MASSSGTAQPPENTVSPPAFNESKKSGLLIYDKLRITAAARDLRHLCANGEIKDYDDELHNSLIWAAEFIEWYFDEEPEKAKHGPVISKGQASAEAEAHTTTTLQSKEGE